MKENYQDLISDEYQERERNQVRRLRCDRREALGLKKNP
jgi:hypothetical protein